MDTLVLKYAGTPQALLHEFELAVGSWLPKRWCASWPMASRFRSHLMEMVRTKWSRNEQKSMGMLLLDTSENWWLVIAA